MWYPDEDAFWERVREQRERLPKDWTPDPERRILVLEDDIDMLENEYGCELTEVSEDNLYDIVYRLCGDTPVRVEYDSQFLAIFYEVEAEAS